MWSLWKKRKEKVLLPGTADLSYSCIRCGRDMVRIKELSEGKK